MTKAHATTFGTEYGINFANTLSDDILRADLDASRDSIRQAAASAAVTGLFRTLDSPHAQVFIEAFTRAAGLRFLGRRNDLSDVQEENRRSWIARYLTRTAETAQGTLDKFRAALEKDPCYAFEWGASAMEAAAQVDVLRRLRAVFEEFVPAPEKPDESPADAVLEAARREAMRGAQYPSHSTSQPSNLMHQYKTQAYAAFVSECSVRF